MPFASCSLSRRAVVLALLAGTASWPTWAATTPGDPKDVALRRKATGVVTAVDAGARQLTLKGPRGAALYRVDPKVGNLEQVQVGDRVKIDYVAALVLTLKRGGKEVQQQAESQAQARAGAGGTGIGEPVPGGTTVVTQVVSVNTATQTVRLKGPEGRVEDFRIQDPADLVGVRAGDRVVAVVHEAVVVGLEPASR